MVVVLVWMNGGEQASDAKICYLEFVFGGDDQVLRFDITMNNASSMRIANACASLNDQIYCFLRCEYQSFIGSFADDGFQVSSGNVLHYDIQPVIAAGEVMDGDDIRVGQVGRGHGFLAEEFLDFFVFGIILAKNLDCNRAVQLGIIPFIDNRHSAGAQGFFKNIAIPKDDRLVRLVFHDSLDYNIAALFSWGHGF